MSERPGRIALSVAFLLTQLGLAGSSDAVEWQDRFEVDVMQHWRSVKERSIAVLLDRLPFRVQSWMLDYPLLGGITARSMPRFWVDRRNASDQKLRPGSSGE